MWKRVLGFSAVGLISLSSGLCVPQSPGSVSYAANKPIEDRFIVDRINAAHLAGVFDGHGGWQVSDYLQTHIKSSIESFTTSGHSWSDSLKLSFDAMEKELADSVRSDPKFSLNKIVPVGSCAIAAIVLDSLFIVANAGDCQAVLVTYREGSIIGENICEIHSANIKSEQEKLIKAHPGEQDIVYCSNSRACYVKGRLMPTRSFGDFHLKFQDKNTSSIFRVSKSKFTAPYITHEPDIQVREIKSQDRFLILASDGLWDELTPNQAAEIVEAAKSPQEAADLLLEAALNHSALDNGISRKELNELPYGVKRRYHDDITIVVVPLNN